MAEKLRADAFFPQIYNGLDPEKAERHLKKYWDYVHEHNLIKDNDHSTAIRRFTLSVDGPARDWLSGKVFNKLEDLEKAFVSHFSGLHSKEAERLRWKEIRMKNNEAVETFVSTKLRNLAKRMQKSEDDIQEKLMDCLEQHLPTATLQNISLLSEGDLTKTIQMAQKMLDQKQSTKNEVTFTIAESSTQQNIDKLVKSVEQLCLAQEKWQNRGRERYRRSESPHPRYRRTDSSYGNSSQSRSRSRDYYDRYRSKSPRQRYRRTEENRSRSREHQPHRNRSREHQTHRSRSRERQSHFKEYRDKRYGRSRSHCKGCNCKQVATDFH